MNADAVAALPLTDDELHSWRMQLAGYGHVIITADEASTLGARVLATLDALDAAPLPSDTPAETHCAAHATYFGGCDECERVASDTEARMASDTPADGLDAAWREAEAALPNDLDIRLTRRAAGGYTVELVTPEFRDGAFVRGEATPVEAFRAALALTQEPREEAE